MQIVECIPNFSEARRPEVVDQIAAAIASIEGVAVLDRSSDLDHNRTVMTFAGEPANVEEAAFRAIQKAGELIDLTRHRGEHPRIGATDVVPFVPISEVAMEECVNMARRLGQRVGMELGIPVYLYEAAATASDRVNLENLRRGQFEGLRSAISTDPSRRPDFGPQELGPAGATVIGAREPLIAFNAYLTTDDVEIARKVARAIRHSSGGLRFVKALGLMVEGRAQVSMNLTNYRQTPVGRVVELVRREAERYGQGIHHCELVGLIPQDALLDAAAWYAQLDGFSTDQILERKLFATGLMGTPRHAEADKQHAAFLDQVAAATPAPGGGSAGAYAGALAAALVEMVAGLTIGKARYRDVEGPMQEIRVRASALRAELLAGVVQDAAAFGRVMDAVHLPKETNEATKHRHLAIQLALIEAARVPLHTATCAAEVLGLAAKCAAQGNLNAISDAASGAALAGAAVQSAAWNVKINLRDVEDRKLADPMLEQVVALEERCMDASLEVQRAVADRALPTR
jgi:glutamate formiminotransferase/formiminotetrahydrofolate cyclodeaminase